MDKDTMVAEADVDGGFDGASVEAAETLWACLPRVRKWTSLATHEKALVIHTLARHRIQSEGRTGAGEALADAARLVFEAWDAHVTANERTNAAIPAIDATRAEREVYDERYRASEEAKREWYRSMHRFIETPGLRAALAQPVEAGEDGLSRRVFVTCVAGDGPTPYLKVHFNTLADAHAAHDQLLGTSRGAK